MRDTAWRRGRGWKSLLGLCGCLCVSKAVFVWEGNLRWFSSDWRIPKDGCGGRGVDSGYWGVTL